MVALPVGRVDAVLAAFAVRAPQLKALLQRFVALPMALLARQEILAAQVEFLTDHWASPEEH